MSELLVNGLTSITQAMPKSAVQATGESDFGSVFQSFLNMYDQTNELQISAEKLQLDFAAGRTDDMVSVILAQEKAYTSLNFTVQVTNKIIEAYREIMRMQI